MNKQLESRENIYQNALSGYLSLSSPSGAKDSPSIFEFERFRELEFDWIAETKNQPAPDLSSVEDNIDDIREYFEKSWKKYLPADKLQYVAPNSPFLTLQTQTKVWEFSAVWLPSGTEAVQAADTFCLIHKPSERKYAFLDMSGNLITKKSIVPEWTVATTNEAAWKSLENFSGYQLAVVFSTSDDAKLFSSSVTQIKREAPLFKEEYDRLNAQLEFVNLFNTNSKKFTEDMMKDPKLFQILWDDEDELEKVAGTYANVKAKASVLEQKMRQLAEKVKEHGYFLALKDETIGPVAVTRGKIYQTRLDTYTRKDVYRRQERRKIGDGKNKRYVYVWVETPVYTAVSYVNYIEVNLYDDPVTNFVNKNLKDYNVYTVERRFGGFYTESGIRITEILKRCENDEAFRRKCCIIIPQYDFLLSNKNYYVGAFLYKHPLPGFIPTRYPSLGLREELSYRLAWNGTEIGHLISSINLAPGETRTINVSSKFKQTTSQTASFKSISDINTSESFDLATEFQNEATKEMSRTDSMSASVGGSYGIGPFSASASASGSRSTNLKTFSRDMARVAKKSAQSINRKLTQEITSTSSLSTEVSQESNKSITISNINKGSTLNLMFYQVNNKYDSALFLTDVDVQIGATYELIAGSNIYETFSFKFHELDDIFEKVHPEILPGKTLDPGGPDAPEWKKYWAKIVETFKQAILKEYDTTSGAPESAGVLTFSQSQAFQDTFAAIKRARPAEVRANMINLPELSGDSLSLKMFEMVELNEEDGDHDKLKGKRLLDAGDKFTVCEVAKMLKTALVNKEITERPLQTETLVISSGGLYVDSLVGAMRGTEDYSELMRELESQKVLADIQKQLVANDEVRAKTNFLLRDETFIREIFVHYTDTPGARTHYVLLQLTKPVADENWKIYFRNTELALPIKFSAGTTDKKSLTITWSGEAPSIDALNKELYLLHKTNSQVLRKF